MVARLADPAAGAAGGGVFTECRVRRNPPPSTASIRTETRVLASESGRGRGVHDRQPRCGCGAYRWGGVAGTVPDTGGAGDQHQGRGRLRVHAEAGGRQRGPKRSRRRSPPSATPSSRGISAATARKRSAWEQTRRGLHRPPSRSACGRFYCWADATAPVSGSGRPTTGQAAAARPEGPGCRSLTPLRDIPGGRCRPMPEPNVPLNEASAWASDIASRHPPRRERPGFLLRGSCGAPVGCCFTGTCRDESRSDSRLRSRLGSLPARQRPSVPRDGRSVRR